MELKRNETLMMDQAEGLRTMMKDHRRQKAMGPSVSPPEDASPQGKCPRVFSVASGKGGVGKTNVVANLGLAFTQMGKRILVLDADLGLANIDVLLGLVPHYTIEHLFDRSRTFPDILIKGPGGMWIMPASSGVLDLVDLKEAQKLFLLNEIDLMADQIDVLLIDTGAGISSNVLYFNMAAQESIVIVTPEPTSITDAYALIKVLSTRFKKKSFMIIVNLVENDREAREVFRKISLVADRFLDHLSIDYLGFIPLDDKLPLAVKQQRAVLELYPKAPSSQGFRELARRLAEKPVQSKGDGQIQFFWKQLLHCHSLWEHKGEIG
jgi:flagellar biosynthesis protein FlhG